MWLTQSNAELPEFRRQPAELAVFTCPKGSNKLSALPAELTPQFSSASCLRRDGSALTTEPTGLNFAIRDDGGRSRWLHTLSLINAQDAPAPAVCSDHREWCAKPG